MPQETSADTGAMELYHLIHRFGKVFRQTDTASGLPPAQLSALTTTTMHGPLPMGRLAGYERVEPQSVSRVVDDLDRQALTRRRPDPDDRRRTLVEVTAKGARVAQAARRKKIDYIARYLASLSPAERRVVSEAVAVLEPMLDS